MKKGDVVTVRDSSYSKVVTNHGLESGYGDGEIRNLRKEQGMIIETNCVFSDPHHYQVQIHTCNDTVIVLDSGEIVFIEERFLKLVLPTHKVMIDMILHPGYGVGGDVIEISDKLYKEIKRES